MTEHLTVQELLTAYRSKSIDPGEVVDSILERAVKYKHKNIWIYPPSKERIQPYIDRLAAFSPEELPLWGVPFAVKDNIDVAGWPTTAGCEAYTYTPDKHASVVERLVDAGAIPVGKTNLDQFATGLVGTRSPYGETHNAHKDELISGGSSAGSAVAVACGLSAFSLGTDTAGSGRVPAALHGLIGWKPSLGAWPISGVVPACESLDCVTVFTWEINDIHLVDRIARGMDPGDPWSKPFKSLQKQKPKKWLLPEEELEFYGPYEEEYRQAWKKTVEQLEQGPEEVSYVNTSILSEAASVLYDGPWIAERWAALGTFVEKHRDDVFPVTEKVLSKGEGRAYGAAELFETMHRLQEIKHHTGRWLENNVLVLPTCGGTWTREEVQKDPVQTNSDMGKYTNHCNLLDMSAIALPAGQAAPEVPFGVTLFSRSDAENLLMGAAESWQRKELSLPEEPAEKLIAVCGLHMRGFPLEKQMTEHRAEFVEEASTAPEYKLIRLNSEPAKPGLIREEAGEEIDVELWQMPIEEIGKFAAKIPAPLGIGTIKLNDGRDVMGFICESSAKGEDISSFKGWKSAEAAKSTM
ncbi:allophanate hydrolase [Marinococcus halophilus]|uniref:Allophanate hydrolase n=1 Tax=Marinococcus halophilus TaxID=1371 RepID=A0A510Y4W6_MARHA|nr:allophanate hydrolase [Marinococcus halophilus]OZT80340.1 allophanate hydrolase [Marinococcus halophilus]GEK58399.1 allophanate hydrolase [Marinococcus halophilus]